MRSLNLDHLKAFATVVELGSFSAAARRLHLTQPAVSQQVKALEERFGVALIERLGRSAKPSAPGKLLMELQVDLFRQCDLTIESMKRFTGGWMGRISIGTTLTTLSYRLPPVLRNLHKAHPGIELVVTNSTTADTLEAVASGDLDFGLITLPVKQSPLRITSLKDEKLVAVLPSSLKSLPARVSPEFLRSHSLILEHPNGALAGFVKDWLSRSGIEPASIVHTATVEAAKALVAAGLGISIVPDIAAGGHDIVCRPISPAISTGVGLVEPSNRPDCAAYGIVRDALMQL